jgi:chromosome segregation ATPase
MAQRVIVFEKDASFVRELEEGFGRMGLTVETSRDPEAAIAHVREGDVRLILISVDAMGAPGEAFLVCKRFKSDDDLAKVPLVIMGGAQHAESFESHKKLKKRRADEYVQLPISFASLISQVAPTAGLSSSGQAAPLEPEEDIVHFLDAEDVEGGSSSQSAAPAQANDVQDEDIDAFAENAFGELLRDEEHGKQAEPQFVSALHAEPSAPEIDHAEVERLRDDAAIASRRANEAEQRLHEFGSQITEAQRKLADTELRLSQAEARAQKAEADRITAKAKQDEADLRAEAAERRAKEAAAAPAPVAAAAPGISSRDYLDLREQLNRKDKELLSLRDEITQRDRQLLDASDKSLVLERTQAELHDNIAATQRQRDEALAKVKTYEIDREAVTKRLEDFRGRLARAEDKGKRVEDELEALKASSTREIADLKTAHEQTLSARDAAAASEAERLRTSHATAISELEARLQREVADANTTRENQVAALRSAHEKSISEARANHERELEDRRRAAEAEAEARRRAADAALANALAEAASERTRALEALASERAQELERRLADAERAKNAALAGLQRELETKANGERKEAEDRHTAVAAALQLQLTEAQNHGSALETRIAELEQAKTALDARLSARIGALEGDLEQRTNERDNAHNELSAMRASIASLERTGAALNDRVSALESDLGRANDRIDSQNAKIAMDKELLDRVRRALGIGIGLLEQQKHNVV